MGLLGMVRNLQGGNVNALASNHIAVTANMASATWNTAASHEVFTVTGTVRMWLWVLCTDTLTDAADAADIQFGVAGATDAFIAATAAAGKGGAGLAAGEVWCDATPADTYGNASSLILDKIVSGGLDVGYEITGAALTGGSLEFHCVWVPLDDTGNVEAGAGGTL